MNLDEKIFYLTQMNGKDEPRFREQDHFRRCANKKYCLMIDQIRRGDDVLKTFVIYKGSDVYSARGGNPKRIDRELFKPGEWEDFIEKWHKKAKYDSNWLPFSQIAN